MTKGNGVAGRFSKSASDRLMSGSRFSVLTVAAGAVAILIVGIGIGSQITKAPTGIAVTQEPSHAEAEIAVAPATNPMQDDLVALTEKVRAVEALQQKQGSEIASFYSLMDSIPEIRKSIQVLHARVTALEMAVISSDSSLPGGTKPQPQ